MNRKAVIALLAHVDAGKTTLSEGILYLSGKLKSLGRVDKKDAFLDNYTLERERGITIFSKQAVFDWKNTSYTLLDTPGHVDFSTEMERTLSVLDAAVLVVSAPDGIEAHTRTLWKLFQTYDIPTFIFVNKMDRYPGDRSAIIAALNAGLSSGCVDMTGIGDKAPDSTLAEEIAMCDEEVLNDYLESGEMSDDTIIDLMGERKLFPCFFGCALKTNGVDALLDGIDRFIPIAEPDTDEFGARVFKISHDKQGNRLTYIKVTSGKLRVRDMIGDEKITAVRIYSGAGYESAEEIFAGSVAALVGLEKTYTGQGLGTENDLFSPRLVPVMTYRIAEKDRTRLLGLMPKLKILEEEDPTLEVLWNSEASEFQVRVMGDIRLDLLKRELHDRFSEDVEFDTGSIIYRETVAEPTLGVGHFEPLKHYAEAQLIIEPAEPGSGITASSIVSTDDLDMNWQRLILTHVFEKEHKGVLTGSMLTDVKITLAAGRAHIKHTEGGDFRQATYRAIRQGLMRAKSVLLEPYYDVSLEIPRTLIGRAMTDIEKRYGRISEQEELGYNDMVRLSGVAPASTMQGYSRELTAYSQGLGSYYCTFHGYLSCHNADEVIESMGYDPEADLANPSSSVFCAHGAGFVVPWNEVDAYKHLDFNLKTRTVVLTDKDIAGRKSLICGGLRDDFISTDEVDSIIERSSNANRRVQGYKNPFRKHREKVHAQEGPKSSDPKYLKNLQNDRPGRERYLLVDGYNIIFAWKELNDQAASNIDGAREKLNDILCDYQAVRGDKLIVVYDAYRVAGHKTEYFKRNNINVVFTQEAETADRFIERFAHENSKQYDVTVATSDGLEQIIIRGAGCKLMTASDLYEDVRRLKQDTSEKLVGHSGRLTASIDLKDAVWYSKE